MGHVVQGNTVFVQTKDDWWFWKLRDLEWRATRSRGDYRGLYRKLDELIDERGVPLRELEERLLGAPVRAAHPEALRRYFDNKRLGQARARLAELGERLKHAGARTSTAHLERLADLGDRMVRAARRIVDARRERLSELQKCMRSFWHRAMPHALVLRLQKSTPDVRYECELDTRDRELVTSWRRGTSEKERERLEWARRGEKAAFRYYETGLGQPVADISLRQLDGSTRDWATHDLEVDSRRLDVKNIRTERTDRFGEHLWPDHKRRRGGDEIGIVGVVSELASDGCTGTSLVLGEVGDVEVRRLHEEVNTAAAKMDLVVEINRDNGWRNRVPGWLFEYSDCHYAGAPGWVEVVSRCRAIFEGLQVPLAPWLAGLAAARGGTATETLGLPAAERVMFEFAMRVGVSRRTLFWLVLLCNLAYRHDAKARKELRSRVFFDDDVSRPLGVHDPQKYVWNVAQTLEEMITSNNEVVGRATNFRLRGVNILQACIEGGPWHTILAYCGNCGRQPIFLGASEACPCGRRRLLCDDPACLSCGLRNCNGHEYDTVDEARNAARRLPGWRQTGRWLKPPSN